MNTSEYEQLLIILTEIRDELEVTNNALLKLLKVVPTISDSHSSVELKSSARGVDITAKAYAESPIGEAGTTAMLQYGIMVRQIKRQIESNWTLGLEEIMKEQQP